MDLEAIGKGDHRQEDRASASSTITRCRSRRPEEVAALIRRALKQIPPERLVIASDCGMGREGMSRRHAFFKMVALVQGTNIVRASSASPKRECLRRR